MIQLNLCDCGKRTIYARGFCYVCYRRWWAEHTIAPITHGTRYAYLTRRCRCEPCTEAARAYWRDK